MAAAAAVGVVVVGVGVWVVVVVVLVVMVVAVAAMAVAVTLGRIGLVTCLPDFVTSWMLNRYSSIAIGTRVLE